MKRRLHFLTREMILEARERSDGMFPTPMTCSYCDCVIEDQERQCPYCGAKTTWWWWSLNRELLER